MAIDIMQTLVGLLCPTYSAQSACQSFINNPSHQVLQPLGPLIFFLFFPTVFLILLIYIGTGVVLRGNVASVKGLRLLLAVAVLVAIVIQGYYPLILWISDLWFLLLPFLFILFFIVRHRGGGGGGRGGSMHGTNSIAKGGNWFKQAIFGEYPLDPRERMAQIKLIGDEITILESQIHGKEKELKDIPKDAFRERAAVQAELTKYKGQRDSLKIKLKAMRGESTALKKAA